MSFSSVGDLPSQLRNRNYTLFAERLQLIRTRARLESVIDDGVQLET